MTFYYNVRAGPQRAWLSYIESDGGLDCVRFDYISYTEHLYVNHGLGEEVLKTLGFVMWDDGIWERLGTVWEG